MTATSQRNVRGADRIDHVPETREVDERLARRSLSKFCEYGQRK